VILPFTFIFTLGNDQTLQWGPVVNGVTGDPVTDALVTATLYQGRVNGYGGAPVAGLTGVVLVHEGAGVYQTVVLGTDLATTLGANYTLVVDANSTSAGVAHWEEKATVTVRNG